MPMRVLAVYSRRIPPDEVAIQEMVYTRKGVDRILKYALVCPKQAVS